MVGVALLRFICFLLLSLVRLWSLSSSYKPLYRPRSGFPQAVHSPNLYDFLNLFPQSPTLVAFPCHTFVNQTYWKSFLIGNPSLSTNQSLLGKHAKGQQEFFRPKLQPLISNYSRKRHSQTIRIFNHSHHAISRHVSTRLCHGRPSPTSPISANASTRPTSSPRLFRCMDTPR